MPERAERSTHSNSFASSLADNREASTPFFPALIQDPKGPKGDCSGWLKDKESLTKSAVEHYLRNALGTGGTAQVLKISNNGKWYTWTVQTPTGSFTVAVSITKLPNYLIVRKQPSPDGPRCEYNFVCTPKGDIRFITRKCEKK